MPIPCYYPSRDFLFEVEKNKLTVVATDLETVMKVHPDIEAKDSGKFCIPPRS